MTETNKMMTIGGLSNATGVKVTTIRYYESIGLMHEPDRSASGQRLFDDDAVQRLSFIRHARDLGFGMDAIRSLMDLQLNPKLDCRKADEIAREQLGDVRKRIGQLQALHVELQRMVTGCEGNTVEDCHVMAVLNNHSTCKAETHDRIKGL